MYITKYIFRKFRSHININQPTNERTLTRRIVVVRVLLDERPEPEAERLGRCVRNACRMYDARNAERVDGSRDRVRCVHGSGARVKKMRICQNLKTKL